jgi:multidrug efflux pump subunit AcrB
MTAVVRLALARPYTFVVMAILVMIFGALSAIRTPTDIFPNIGIPVISAVWSYTGLSPDDMAGRIVTHTSERSRPPSTTSSISSRSRFPAWASSRSSSSRA